MTKIHERSDRAARTLLGLQAVSDFGDQISAALIALLVIDITKSTSKVGLVYLLSTFGFVFFTLLGGYLGDRISKRLLLSCADLGRGFVVLAMIFALFMKSLLLIYAASFFLSLLGSIHRPVKLSLWAASLPRHRHELYNSLSEVSTHTSVIAGPLIAAILIARDFANFGFVLDALTFFICALTFYVVVGEHKPATNVPHAKSDVLIGFKHIFRSTELGKYISIDAIQMITHGAFNATLLVLLQRDYGFSKTQFSIHLSLAAAFAVAGALLGFSKHFVKINSTTKIIVCNFVVALSYALILVVKTFPLASIFFGICNAAAVITMVVTKTKVQLYASQNFPEALTSILAARSILIKGATLFGTALCLVVDHFSNLEFTLWLLLAPLAFAVLPLVDEKWTWQLAQKGLPFSPQRLMRK